MSDKPPKFCKDCKHAKLYGWRILTYTSGDSYYCRAQAYPPNLVTGKILLRRCLIARSDMQACGPEGKLFEPKDQ